MRTPLGLTLLAGSFMLSAPTLAQQCTVPHTLTNGQVADATEVMENFNAVAACADDTKDNAVTHNGAPNAGEIAVFDSATGVTGGNLTGDVTTSGSTATSLTATGVTPGTYTNATITVDDKGRVTFADSGALSGGGSGGASLATKYEVITPGDNFIDVQLDADDGYAYRILLKGTTNAATKIYFRISSDNGQTFYSGSSDYKSNFSGAASRIELSGGDTIATNRNTIVTFTIAGMNVAANERMALVGEVFSVRSGGNIVRVAGGHNNVLQAGNFNAFRISTTGGTMDDFAVYIQRIY